MSLDSDISNPDNQLHVEFYTHNAGPNKQLPYVRIMTPGDKTNIIEQPAAEHYKERFVRQWLHYQSKNSDYGVIGTKLDQWCAEKPEDFNEHQLAELQILKFQTVEQVAMATDSQLQRIGMGAAGIRERARGYLAKKNQSQNTADLVDARTELEKLKAQMADLIRAGSYAPLAKRKPGRPRKEFLDVNDDNASVGATSNE
jgi:hypothetical protein